MMVVRSLPLRAILMLVFAGFVFSACPEDPTDQGEDTVDIGEVDAAPDMDAPDEADTDVVCDPVCADAACGDPDECGGQCLGTCEDGFYCTGDFVCEPEVCVPCSEPGAVCGDDDGCGEGGQCLGTCEDGFACVETPVDSGLYACEEICVPKCDGKACGDPDECDEGGLCDGFCELGFECNDEYECVETPCALDCLVHSDCEDAFTEAELGACQVSRCVDDLACGDLQCTIEFGGDPLCCEDVDDCPEPNECANVECIENDCVYTKIPGCCVVAPMLLYAENFDALDLGGQPPEGSPAALTITDEDPLDAVTWTVRGDPCGGGKALYLGNPDCLDAESSDAIPDASPTYFNGELYGCQPLNTLDCINDDDCPGSSTCDIGVNNNNCTGEPSTQLTFEAVVPQVDLPADSFVSLFYRVRTDLEPPTEDEEGVVYVFDTLRLFVEYTPDPGQPPVLAEVHVAPQSTDGACTLFAADLTTFAPVTILPDEDVDDATIKLIWRFDTLDGTDNHFPGLWLDDIRVETYCDSCANAADCDDGNVCTSGDCVDAIFGGEVDEGLCFKPEIFENCVPCGEDVDCEADAPVDPDDPCEYLWMCAAEGYCEYWKNPECCTVPTDGTQYALDAGLEEGELPQGWEVEVTEALDPLTTDVTWQVTNATACGGSYALHFGNGQDYDCGQPLCAAQVTTPEIDLSGVEEDFELRLSFCTHLSTEWDIVEPGAYPENNASTIQIDVLYAEVLVGDLVTEVWNSDIIEGTTHGLWEDAWADLSAFKGETIRVRFRFFSGDAMPANNEYAGAFIDNLRIEKVCEPVCETAADCTSGGDCTTAMCDFGVCSYPVDTTCCTADINPDCDDGNDCTDDSCQLASNTCINQFNGDPSCCEPTLDVFADSFISLQNPDWYVPEEIASCGIFPYHCEDEEGENCANCPTDCGLCPVRWSITADQSFTAPFSLYFGNPDTGTYENGQNSARGWIASPDVTLPVYGIPAVGFHLWLDTEHTPIYEFFGQQQGVDFDILRLHVQENIGNDTYGEMTEVWNSLAWDTKGSTFNPNVDDVVWKLIYVALEGMELEGETVRFVFEFDSESEYGNDYQGAYVDDFKVSTLCDDAFECLSAYDCPDTTPAKPDCSIELCVDANGPDGISGECIEEANLLAPADLNCCMQEVVGEMTSDFDSPPCDMEGWVASPTPEQTPVAWQTWDQQNNTQGGECALYFGDPDTGSYDNPGQVPQGMVTSPTWAIPEGLDAEVEVSFWIWMDLEDTWSLLDTLKLYMGLKFFPTLPPDGPGTLLWSKPCDMALGFCDEPLLSADCDLWGCVNWPWGQWKHVTVAVPTSMFDGYSDLVFWFEFDAQDAMKNDGVGVFVDDFEVRKTTCQ